MYQATKPANQTISQTVDVIMASSAGAACSASSAMTMPLLEIFPTLAETGWRRKAIAVC
jgi:hypothetical protein